MQFVGIDTIMEIYGMFCAPLLALLILLHSFPKQQNDIFMSILTKLQPIFKLCILLMEILLWWVRVQCYPKQ